MKKKINSKLMVRIVLVVVLVIVLTAGISYAFFNYLKLGTKTLSFETGSIRLELGEIGEGISLVDQFPIDDESGKALTNTYTFTITGYNTGTIPIYYDVLAILGNEIEGKTRFNDDEIKVYITDELGNPVFDALSPIGIGTTGESTLITDMIPGNTPKASPVVKTYVLRIWITSDKVWISETDQIEGKNTYTVSEFANRYFSMKIKVNGNLTPRVTGSDLLTTINNKLSANFYTPEGDTDQTFIVGTASDTNYNPDNYLWYSGKMWRIVALNKTDDVVTSIKLISESNLTTINYNSSSADAGGSATTFLNSFAYQWLTEDFYDTLRNPTQFLVTDYSWNATTVDNGSIARPAKTTMVTSSVGLLSNYEYGTSYTNTTAANGYLNNGTKWWLISIRKDNGGYGHNVNPDGTLASPSTYGTRLVIRPAINLKPNIKIVAGNGTVNNPFRLNGDNDQESELINRPLNTRYSGEYVLFDGENYRIVSIENNRAKLVKDDCIKVSGTCVTKQYGTGVNFSQGMGSTGYWPGYLNNSWYASLSTTLKDMIESSNWYYGYVSYSSGSYKLGLCATVNTVANGGTLTKDCPRTTNTTTANVGLLRMGEMFAAPSNGAGGFLITPPESTRIYNLLADGTLNYSTAGTSAAAKGGTFYLTPSVYITGGDGTPNNPFLISM